MQLHRPTARFLLCVLLAWPAAAETLRVGVYHNPPKVIAGEGEPAGFWPALIRVIAERENVDIEWVFGSWEASLQQLEANAIDVMPDVAVTEDRAQRFRFGNETVHVSWSQVYRAPAAAIETIPDLGNRRIGALADSINLVGPEGLESLLTKFAVDAEVVVFDDYPAIFAALARGELDAAVTNRDFGRTIREQTGALPTPILFQPADLRFAFSRQSDREGNLVQRFDRQLRILKQDPDSAYYQLQEQWLGIRPSGVEQVIPVWLGALLAGLAGISLLLLAGIGLVEMRVRVRTRQLHQQTRQLQAVNDRNRHFQQLLEGSDDLSGICDRHYRFLWVNNAYAARHGLAPQDVEGRHIQDIVGQDYFERELRAPLQACLDGEIQRLETSRNYPELGRRHLLVRYYPIERNSAGEVVCIGAVITDVTAMKRVERQSSRLAEGLKHTLESISDAFLTLDRDWHFRYINTAAEKLLKRDRDKLLGRKLWEVFPDSSGTDIGRAYYEALAENEPREMETYYPPLEKWLSIRIFPSAQGLAVYFVDITERHRLIEQLQEQEEHLRHSRDQLERFLETRRALINSLPAHIALLDDQARIIDVNDQWRRFGRENQFAGPDFGVGDNYLAICERASGDQADEAGKVAQGLREVMQGERASFSLEYPCHSPGQLSWFRVSINPLVKAEKAVTQHGIVVMHLDITERKLAEQELNRLAYQDPLTTLLSRNGFINALVGQVENSRWTEHGIVAALDIIGMRDINDAHGFDVGDQCLIKIGQRLQQMVGEKGLAGRPGGDEFILYLLPDSDPAQQLETLITDLSRPIAIADIRLEIDVRLGYTCLGSHPRRISELLREAELALFQHREIRGFNCLSYTSELDEKVHQRVALTRELKTALAEQQFELYFQPKVNLPEATIMGCEALLRWNHPQRGMQPPGLFIPIAEKSQLIVPLGDWIVREACRRLAEWRAQGFVELQMAVNVSLLQFSFGDFPATVAAALEEFAIPAQLLSLEITESVFEEESQTLFSSLQQLRELGVRLSLDDFGTGYSSLQYLQKYTFNEIKIDQGFVRHMLEDDYSHAIVGTVMSLARTFGADVVAEGIETAAMSDVLEQMGCRIGQGYHFSYPLPAGDFLRVLGRGQPLPVKE